MYRNNLYTYTFAGGLVLVGVSVCALYDQQEVDPSQLKTLHSQAIVFHYLLYFLVVAGLTMMFWAVRKWYRKVYKINQLYR